MRMRKLVVIGIVFLLAAVGVALKSIYAQDENKQITQEDLKKQMAQELKAKCMNRLKQIGKALHMYAADHNDKFPEDLSVLYRDYVAKLEIFKCPGDKTLSESGPGTGNSYVYIKGLAEKDSSDSIIAYDASPDNHGGEGRNVLFLDGHVRWYDENEFQKLLK